MIERGVDYTLTPVHCLLKTFQIIDIATPRFCACAYEFLDSIVRSSQTQYLVARFQKFRDQGGAYKAIRTGNENSHACCSSVQIQGLNAVTSYLLSITFAPSPCITTDKGI